MENVIKGEFGKKPEENPQPVVVQRELKAFQVDVCCVKCDTYMHHIDHREQNLIWQKFFAVNPTPLGGKRIDPLYLHRCPSCGGEAEYPIAYPTIQHRFVE